MNNITVIFLTGGTGFIGKNFVELYKNKYKILMPTHTELDLLNTEAVDEFFRKNKIDVVVHCANIGGLRNDSNSSDSVKTNLKIFFNLVKNKDRFKKMVHMGSGAEYNKSKDIIDVREIDFGSSVPDDNYGFYKYLCSKYIERSNNIYCLRIFGVFGKYEDYNIKFISNLICKYICRLPLTMIQDCKFDYIYINDFVKIIGYFIENSPEKKIFNVGSGKKVSLFAIVNIINELGDYSLPIVVKRSGLNREYTSNIDLLKNEIKDLKLMPIDQAIKNLYQYYLSIQSNFDSNLLTANE